MRKRAVRRDSPVEFLEQRWLLSVNPTQSTEELFPGGVIIHQDSPPLPVDTSAPSSDPGGGLSVGSFDIVLEKGPNLMANPAASAAFDQAAAFLESIFSDPITVVVDAEIAPLGAGVLGQTSDVTFFGSFDSIRSQVVGDRAPDESIAAGLPTQAQFTDITPPPGGGSAYSIAGMSATRANMLALGFPASALSDSSVPFSQYNPAVKRDMSITFSSDFPFDYDRSDGIASGEYDFVGVAIHELAHGLGFVSEVDDVDAMQSNPSINRTLSPTPLDLYRLQPGAGATNFTTAPRVLATGNTVPNQVFYDGGIFDPTGITNPTGLKTGDIPMSTGLTNGDGKQASHWKDNQLDGGVQVGIMDPSAEGTAKQLNWQATDTRAMGLIGYNVAAVTGAPGTPDLVDASDTGSSSTDNITSLDNSTGTKTLQFNVGNTVAGALVTVYADGVAIGSATASGSTTLVTTNGAIDLTDGNHTIAARQAEAMKAVSNPSSPLTINVDTAGPTSDVTDASPDPRQAAVPSVGVTFSQAVTGFDFHDLTLRRDGVNVTLGSANNPTSADGGVTWTIPNLSSLTTATGTYVLSVASGSVTDLAGNPLAAAASDTWQNFPAWLSTSSIASWNGTTKALTITGAASIVGDPAADLPAITASGAGAALTINPSNVTVVKLASLSLSGGAKATLSSHGAGTIRALSISSFSPQLSIDASSKLDLTDNAMVIKSGSLTLVQSKIAAGFHGGDWLGAGGITSSTAAANPAGLTALGYAANADIGLSTFAGVTGLTAKDVLVRYTYYGDADLDGRVTLDDFSQFLNGYQTQSAATNNWLNGDFDYSGNVTLDDFSQFLFGYQTQGAAL